MTDRLVQGPFDGSYLVPVLGSLRRHDGLTVKRLTTVPGGQALLRLPVIQNHAVQTGLKPAEAAVEVIVQQVAALESPTDRIIADAVLRLGLYVERYRAHPIPRRALYQLTAGGLGDRRTALLENWSELHAALDEHPPAGQLAGEHTLRARLEREVFERLGAALVNPEAAATSAASSRPVPASRAQTVDATAAGTVIVVGGAAMDHTWRIGTLPAAGRSTLAMEFTRAPGGKGVSQAVAAAHLDLDVALIAAVATDDDGREIEDHLAREGVDISLLHRVDRRGARTPATGIFELPYGNSSAAVWRDDVELDIAAIEQHADVLASCDVLLLTFELPQSVLRRVLDLVATAPDPPVVIVTPGQPYPNPHQVSPLLKQIDYLVAYLWELEGFAFSDEARYDPELLSDDLLSRGLRALCLLSVPNGGSIYERGKAVAQLPRLPGRVQEASVTRDAFCAALAARLIEDRSCTDDTFLWAAAAMASFADNYHEAPTTRPSRATVNKRFDEMPRPAAG